MKELKITDDRVREAHGKGCGTAKAVLEALFPEVFKAEQKFLGGSIVRSSTMRGKFFVTGQDSDKILRKHYEHDGKNVVICLSCATGAVYSFYPHHLELVSGPVEL
jgi:hypothetical protein